MPVRLLSLSEYQKTILFSTCVCNHQNKTTGLKTYLTRQVILHVIKVEPEPKNNTISPHLHRRSSSVTAGTKSFFWSLDPSTSRIKSISAVSNPVISRSKSKSSFDNSANSGFSASILYLPSSVNLLSAMRYAHFCASVKCDRIIAGMSRMLISRATATRPCPAMISRFSSSKTGLIKPNSRIYSRIFAACARLCNFGLFL